MTVPESQHPVQPRRRPQVSAGQIGAALLLVVGLVFVFENTRTVPIRFLVPEVESPLWLALLITFLLGVIVGYLLSRHRSRR
jgi:uncharacterized integral membrane protein